MGLLLLLYVPKLLLTIILFGEDIIRFGDPCYAVPDQFWMDLLGSCDFFSDTLEGNVNGFTVYSAGTMYGDGTYSDNKGRQFPVDAGMIGLTIS